MKMNKIICIILVCVTVAVAVAVAILGFTLGQHSVHNDLTQSDRAVNIDTGEILIADEFEGSPLYSMFWIREQSWIDQGILLVKAEKFHKEFGYALCFAKALIEVKKKYAIVARTSLTLFPAAHRNASTNGLLLEVEPRQKEQKQ